MAIPSGADSQTVNRVSELTLILEIKQGLTTRLDPPTSLAEFARRGLYNPDLPPARYAENLRTALRMVTDWVKSGRISPLNQMATIHYAHWALFDGDARLIFTSNFDGTWAQYLRDFVIVANQKEPSKYHPYALPWMDLVWGNCVGYPGTDDFSGFTDWVHANQVQTDLFFSSISDTTVRDIQWLRQFKQLFNVFDEGAQKINREEWPEELRNLYDALKLGMNGLDVTVVDP